MLYISWNTESYNIQSNCQPKKKKKITHLQLTLFVFLFNSIITLTLIPIGKLTFKSNSNRLKMMLRMVNLLKLQTFQGNPTRSSLPQTIHLFFFGSFLYLLDYRQRWIQINHVNYSNTVFTIIFIPVRPICTIHHNPSPVSTPGGGASFGGGVGVDAGAGSEVLAGEQSLQLGVLDIVVVVGGGVLGYEAWKSESMRSWVANNFVISLNLAHATDSWRYRVIGEGRRATFKVWKSNVFDGRP